MISTYQLIEKQLQQLNHLKNDLTNINQQVKDDKIYLEQKIIIAEENEQWEAIEKYYVELDILMHPVRTCEFEIRQIKKSILVDYAELILTSTGDVSLTNSILKATRNIVQMDNIIEAIQKKFNIHK